MQSIFMDKLVKPSSGELKKALGNTFNLWQTLAEFTEKSKINSTSEWNFSSAKYGWNYRISDKKRVLIYLLPRDKFFKVAFVFSQKATDKIIKSDISEKIKTKLLHAKVFAEGRGIRIEIKDPSLIEDIKKLIQIKISIQQTF